MRFLPFFAQKCPCANSNEFEQERFQPPLHLPQMFDNGQILGAVGFTFAAFYALAGTA
jgi:hypothetical protein